MDYSPTAIITTVGACIALIAGAVKVFRDISDKIDQKKDQKRKERDEKDKQHLSEAAEMKKLDNEARAQNYENFKALLNYYKDRVEKLEKEIEERDDATSLSRPTITRLYQSMRAVGRQIDTCELLLMRGETRENVMVEFEILKQKFVETESLLP